MEESKCTNIEFTKDSTKIRELIVNAQNNSTINFPKALTQARQALNIANSLHNTNLTFSAYRILGTIHEDNNHLTEAFEWYEKELTLLEFLPTNTQLDIYLDWAIINKKLSKYEITREYYQKALNLATKINDQEIVEFVYTGFGTLCRSIGEYDNAIEYHLRSKEIAEKRGHTEGVIYAQVNIANVYMETKNYKLAYSFLQKGYELVVNTPDSVRLDYVLNAFGQVLNAEKKYAEAIDYHQKALAFCQKTGDKWMIARTWWLIADVYTQLAEYKNAEMAFNRCFEYSNFFDFYEQPNLHLSLGNLYVKTNRPNQAVIAFQKSLTMSSKRGFKDLVQKCHLGLADVYEQKGDFDIALSHIKIAEMYKDSIFTEDKTKKIAEVQYRYNTEKSEIEYKINIEKSEKEIQALQLSQNRTFIYLFSVVLFVVFTFIFTLYYIKQKNRNNALLYQKNKEIGLKNDRLEKSNAILKQFAYASAHDLKEPLRTISSFVSIINRRYAQLLPPEASEYMNFVIIGVKRMEKLISALLEYSTVASDVEEVTESISFSQVLNDITDNMHSTILEKNAVVEISGNLPKLKITRLHLTQLFQNLIINAMKFCDKKPLIQISGKIENERYIVAIKDNGIGIKMAYSDKIFRLFQTLSRSTQQEGTGIGLAICKQIVDRYEGLIWFESEENEGTTFYISFPAELIEKDKALKETIRNDYQYSSIAMSTT